MSDLATTIGVALEAVAAERLECALIGGFAVSVRTEPRFTRDVDLAVAVSGDDEAEALTRRLLAEGHEVLATIEHEAVGRLAMVRLQLATDGHLDLLFASSGIEAEVVAAAERTEILPGVVLPVATVGHLIALKLLSRSDERPSDEADLVALVGAAAATDLADAAEGVALIEARGYARDRDLRSALRQVVRDAVD